MAGVFLESSDFAFTVDTHLFRELGELLVGRESTALIELIKNAYDADATSVTIIGRNLRSPSGSIEIDDDGIGMTPEIFRSSFLRIAGRHKEAGDRRSPLYRRRYTGAKGVGRLSAHKLAYALKIRSIPAEAVFGASAEQGIDASIDWRTMEENYQTIDSVGGGLRTRIFHVTPELSKGTRLYLDPLRRRWTSRALSGLVNEISSSVPPEQLLEPPAFEREPQVSLLEQLSPWTRTNYDPGFRIKLKGDLDTGEDLTLRLVQRSNWLLEVKARPAGVTFSIAPTGYHLKERDPRARSYVFHRPHPDPERGPFFDARIYAREGSLGVSASELAQFARTAAGIRVYLEGFRVIPYGGTGDDWLDLNRDYARRSRTFDIPIDGSKGGDTLAQVPNEGFFSLGNDQYFGAVFLTAEGASALRPVVNREGFLRDTSFENLVSLTRNGIDLLTRVRASSNRRVEAGALRELEQDAGIEPSPGEVPDGSLIRQPPSQETTERERLAASFSTARNQIRKFREIVKDPAESEQLDSIEAAVNIAELQVEQQLSDRAMLQVLAGIGLQFAAFVHEVNGLLGQAQSVRTLLEAALEEQAHPRVRTLRDLRLAVEELTQSLARQASYLTEVVGPDARRRRRRIPLTKAAQTSLRLLTKSLESRNVSVTNNLTDEVRTPPIFPAEITIIFTNLLTNAVKAAGEGGRILISGRNASDGGVVIRVENTGQKVDLATSERWFEPFESTTTEVDVVLGQGMGLGLPITRRMLAQYDGTIRFVEPSVDYSTAVEVTLPPREIRQ